MAIGSGLPSAVQDAIQQDLLKQNFEVALRSNLAYSMIADQEDIRARKGATLTLTRASGLAVATVPVPINQTNKQLNAVANGLDNGLSPDQFTTEQYTLTMNEYARTADVNMVDDEVVIAAQALVYAREQGTQAYRTREAIARQRLLDAYMGGNTRVINVSGGDGGIGNPTTTQCDVDDIRGFQFILVNGTLQSVSSASANQLQVNETATSGGGVTQSVMVTGVAAHTINVSSAAAVGGISGILTFATAGNAPVVGDTMVAINAPAIIRAGGRVSTNALTSQDVLTIQNLLDASVQLENNAVPRFDGEWYYAFIGPTAHRQLMADPDFKAAWLGQYNSEEYRKGKIFEHVGIRFVQTTEALPQAANTGLGVNVNVQRTLVIGKGCLLRGDFEGLELWAKQQAASKVHDVKMIDNIAFIVRDPIDRAGQTVSMTWDTIFDFVCPSDLGTTNQIVPTANKAMFKRAAWIESAS